MNSLGSPFHSRQILNLRQLFYGLPRDKTASLERLKSILSQPGNDHKVAELRYFSLGKFQ